MLEKIFLKHKHNWRKENFRASVYSGIVLLATSIFIDHWAGYYANERASHYVNDIILDNIPVVDVDGILNFGVMIFILFVAGYLTHEPKKIPFMFKSMSLFIIIRSAFVTLTHLGAPPIQTPIDQSDLLSRLISGNEFFFSGHTGLPYLLALIFWKNKLARYVSLGASLIFGASVLLGHLHYSIDVFSAFFITYTIFHIAQKFFAKDYILANSE